MRAFHMQHQEFEPPAALRETIKCFWHNRIDFGEYPASFEVFPDGYAEIIFHFGSALSRAEAECRQPVLSPFLMGLPHQPVRFYATKRLDILGIRCFPWSVFEVLGLPSGQDEMGLWEHPLTRLQPALQEWMEAGKRDEAVAELTQYFLRARSQMTTDPDRMLVKAGGAMGEAGGTLTVSRIAAASHATVRTLERKFKHASGYTVKDVSALMRFEQVRNRLWLEPDSSLVGLAAELGYTDQSHLSRDFKRYSGTTPAAFARKAKAGSRL